MAWNPGRFNFFSPDRPGPSLHICSGSPASADFALDGVANTAAATSLTSFINVSGQPHSRKPKRHYFLAFWSMSRRGSIFGRFLVVFSRWKPPDLVGGERSEKEERPFMAVKKALETPLPRAAGPRAAQRSALKDWLKS
jgi:hypothetical protein